MWPLSLNAGERGGDATGKHGARHWRNTLPQTRQKRRTKKKPNSSPHLSVRLGSNGGAFRRLLHGGFLFSSVLGDLRSHALFFLQGCNKGAQPIKWLNKDRKASCPKNSSLPLTRVEEEEAEELRRATKTRRNCNKMWSRREKRFFRFLFFNFSPLEAEFGNGEIGPAANEMRSTTPKSADEWAPGLWRHSRAVSTNHKSRIPTSTADGVGGEMGGVVEFRREGRGQWRESTTTYKTRNLVWRQIFFFWVIALNVETMLLLLLNRTLHCYSNRGEGL